MDGRMEEIKKGRKNGSEEGRIVDKEGGKRREEKGG